MIELAWPWMILALPAPYLVYRFMPAASRRNDAMPVPFFSRLDQRSGTPDHQQSRWRLVILILAWTGLVAAATRPQWLDEPVAISVSGRDIMMAVDVSGSMKAEDMELGGVPQNRLETVKRVASDFIGRRQGDRAGLILFGTRAYLQAPLTFDRKTVVTLLEESAIGIAGEKTAIGDAVGLAVKRLRDHYQNANSSAKILILLTDGANTAGNIDPVEAANLARQIDLKIYAIGVGAESMTVNTVFGQRVVRPSAELDETTLQRMADLTGGQYFRATDPASLAQIYALIDQFEPIVDEDRFLRPRTELFHWFLGLSSVLVLLLSIALAANRIGPTATIATDGST